VNAMPIAMHMANELLSVPVAAVTLLLGAAVVALAALRLGKGPDAERLPLMGVMGAFVFAAQMINFTIPGMPGTSGHLGGGGLLAILLGPAAGIVVMTAILIVQCLLFQDGGLLALGCNVINMALVPCILGWGVYRLLLGPARRAAAWRQYLCAWAACLLGVTAGAALVPMQAFASGVLKISFADFLGVMVGVHLLIGFIEGAITFTVVAYLRRVRPAVLGLAHAVGREVLSRKAVAVSVIGTALLLGGVVSWFASVHPDGLEWSYMEHKYGDAQSAVANRSQAVASVDAWQGRWALMSDYTRRPVPLGSEPAEEPEEQPTLTGSPAGQADWPGVDGWGSLAGVLGTLVTLAVIYLVALVIRKAGSSPAKTGE